MGVDLGLLYSGRLRHKVKAKVLSSGIHTTIQLSAEGTLSLRAVRSVARKVLGFSNHQAFMSGALLSGCSQIWGFEFSDC